MATYTATWKAHGTTYSTQAETRDALEIKVFGRAYAPQPNQVSFLVSQESQGDSA